MLNFAAQILVEDDDGRGCGFLVIWVININQKLIELLIEIKNQLSYLKINLCNLENNYLIKNNIFKII